MADDFETLPSGLRVPSADPVGAGGDALSDNFRTIDSTLGSLDDAIETLDEKIDAAATNARGHVHYQIVPADVWTIAHGLGRAVAVTVTDSAGEVVIGDVTIVDLSTVAVRFTSGFAGRAYVS